MTEAAIRFGILTCLFSFDQNGILPVKFDHDISEYIHELLIDAVGQHGGQEMLPAQKILPGLS